MQGQYSLQFTTIVIDGRVIQGFGEDDVITFIEPIDLAEAKYTADGIPVVSGNRVFAYEAEITVMQGTTGYTDLWEVSQTQRVAAFSTFAFQFQDTGLGDSVFSPSAQFLKRPDRAYGRVAQSQTYRLILPDAQQTGNVEVGLNSTGSL